MSQSDGSPKSVELREDRQSSVASGAKIIFPLGDEGCPGTLGDLGPRAALLYGSEQLGEEPQRVGAEEEEVALPDPIHARCVIWHVSDGFCEMVPLEVWNKEGFCLVKELPKLFEECIKELVLSAVRDISLIECSHGLSHQLVDSHRMSEYRMPLSSGVAKTSDGWHASTFENLGHGAWALLHLS